jgi:hypothetical protein
VYADSTVARKEPYGAATQTSRVKSRNSKAPLPSVREPQQVGTLEPIHSVVLENGREQLAASIARLSEVRIDPLANLEDLHSSGSVNKKSVVQTSNFIRSCSSPRPAATGSSI